MTVFGSRHKLTALQSSARSGHPYGADESTHSPGRFANRPYSEPHNTRNEAAFPLLKREGEGGAESDKIGLATRAGLHENLR
jgi:hypothetical protein